jgi:hypothetical protein
LALASILIRVSPLWSKIGVLKTPCLTRTRLPETCRTAVSGVMVPSTSIVETATLAPLVGAVSDTCTLLKVDFEVDAAPQPLNSANPAPSATMSDARGRLKGGVGLMNAYTQGMAIPLGEVIGSGSDCLDRPNLDTARCCPTEQRAKGASQYDDAETGFANWG